VLTKIEYDTARALTYAREHLPQALKLDAREFEKVAKVLKLDFVTTHEEPQATIATDLSKYLASCETCADRNGCTCPLAVCGRWRQAGTGGQNA
jgi:hypothetical protein